MSLDYPPSVTGSTTLICNHFTPELPCKSSHLNLIPSLVSPICASSLPFLTRRFVIIVTSLWNCISLFFFSMQGSGTEIQSFLIEVVLLNFPQFSCAFGLITLVPAALLALVVTENEKCKIIQTQRCLLCFAKKESTCRNTEARH